MTQILVIEDDPTQRLLTSSVLRSAGYEVTEAVDGAEGLALARKEPPDLIVCDVVMPGLNGYELVMRLRQEAIFSSTPIILLSAMADRSHMRVGMTAGADDYLHKPFRAAELRKSVQALLSKRELQRVQYARVGKTEMYVALELQKESLASRYEERLLQELNARWIKPTGPGSELNYTRATVLVVDLFAAILRHYPCDGALGSVVRRVYQAASDSLYLFGAQYLVPAGDDLVAVFPEASAPEAAKTRLSALRAAFGMQKMVQVAFESVADSSTSEAPVAPSLSIALHVGPVALLNVEDPLHGGKSLTLAVGEAVQLTKALRRQAQASQWRVSCSSEVIADIAEWVAQGEKALLAGEQIDLAMPVVELLAVAQA